MAEIIRMPRMSDTMEEGNIVEWLKKVGDSVEPGDVLAEVETDKATMELESYHEGVLLHIGVKEGPVPVNGILAVIGEKGEDFEAELKAAESEGSGASDESKETEDSKKAEENKDSDKDADSDDSKEKKKQDQSEQSAEKKTDTAPHADSTDDHVKASPLAKSMASSKNIDLSTVKGTGEGGRIVKRDIENYSPTAAAKPAASPAYVPADVSYGSQPVSQMRKIIAKRLGESKFTSPHFYLTVEANMANAIAARKDINEDPDVKISFNDIVIKAVAGALRKHPMINASWKGDSIEVHQDINIGVAVAVEDGLVVPVIKNADTKPMTVINAEVKELAGKARSKKIKPQEMQGNTFTISNLGMFGIEEFTAIINPPDACILAVGTIVKKPIVDKAGIIVVGNMMKVTLSCDHRIVDGATGAQFLKTLKAYLENPIRILV